MCVWTYNCVCAIRRQLSTLGLTEQSREQRKLHHCAYTCRYTSTMQIAVTCEQLCRRRSGPLNSPHDPYSTLLYKRSLITNNLACTVTSVLWGRFARVVRQGQCANADKTTSGQSSKTRAASNASISLALSFSSP